MDNLEQKLKNRLIKPTAMRLLILQYLMRKPHATSLKQIEGDFNHSDRSTLYRTLKTFEEKKVIHSIDDGSGMKKYAFCLEDCECAPQDQHYHFHCHQCKETYCLTSQNVPSIELPAGFTMTEANMVLKGICPNCNF